MSVVESAFCLSAPWRLIAGRMIRWATQDTAIHGEVLEIGGGSGAMAVQLARKFPSARLTTADVDPRMVLAARKRLSRCPQATVRQGDATQLPFDGASFDVVLSFLMLHHVVEWEAAVAEAARVLKPGGAFVGYDLTASRTARWLHGIDRSSIRMFRPGEFSAAIENTGFDATRVSSEFGGCAIRFACLKR